MIIMPNFLGFTEIYFDFQVVDAKVIQLDYNNNRIFLSLKDVKVPGGLSPFPSWWFSLLNCWFQAFIYYFCHFPLLCSQILQ